MDHPTELLTGDTELRSERTDGIEAVVPFVSYSVRKVQEAQRSSPQDGRGKVDSRIPEFVGALNELIAKHGGRDPHPAINRALNVLVSMAAQLASGTFKK